MAGIVRNMQKQLQKLMSATGETLKRGNVTGMRGGKSAGSTLRNTLIVNYAGGREA
jgi:hypothetical protein